MWSVCGGLSVCRGVNKTNIWQHLTFNFKVLHFNTVDSHSSVFCLTTLYVAYTLMSLPVTLSGSGMSKGNIHSQLHRLITKLPEFTQQWMPYGEIQWCCGS